MHNHTLSTLILAAAAALPAQTYVVSPGTLTKHEGDNNNAYPFANGPFRYQQGHGDLKGTPRLLTGMGWRRDGTLGASTGYGVRTLDMEVFIGDCDFALLAATYASNYTNTPVNTFVRKLVSTPDHTALPSVLPAPWDFNLLFDVPAVYVGAKDLLYEVAIYSNSNTAFYPCDAAASTDTRVQGGFASVGTGCTTSKGVMNVRSNIFALSASGTWTLAWSVTGGPPSAATGVMVGFGNPAFPVPGLCNNENLYTDAALFVISGTTSTAGAFTTATITAPFTAGLVDFTLTGQAASIDATQPGLGVAASNGIASYLPPLPGPVLVTRIFSSGNATAPSGSIGAGYGLVTRFRS